MQGAVTPTVAQITILQALIDALTTSEVRVHLYQTDTPPVVSSVLGDFTEADFDSYAPIDLVPNAPAINPEGWAQADLPQAHFESAGAVTPNVIYGYYLTDNTDALLLKAEQFDAPVTINEVGDYIDIQTNLQISDASQVAP